MRSAAFISALAAALSATRRASSSLRQSMKALAAESKAASSCSRAAIWRLGVHLPGCGIDHAERACSGDALSVDGHRDICHGWHQIRGSTTVSKNAAPVSGIRG